MPAIPADDRAAEAPTTPSTPTIAVLLAAGAGARFEGPVHKLLVTMDGRTMVERTISAALDAAIGPLIVVTGAVPLPSPALADPRITSVHNENWAQGQATSIGVGIAAAEASGADAVVIGLGDQPFVSPEAWRNVAASKAPIAVATYDGRRRNPVRLHRSIWSLLPTTGDEGARRVIRVQPQLVEEVPCPGSPVDFDTLEDLRVWQSKSSTSSP